MTFMPLTSVCKPSTSGEFVEFTQNHSETGKHAKKV